MFGTKGVPSFKGISLTYLMKRASSIPQEKIDRWWSKRDSNRRYAFSSQLKQIQKRTVSSNPFRSSNEALRTAGPVRVNNANAVLPLQALSKSAPGGKAVGYVVEVTTLIQSRKLVGSLPTPPSRPPAL